LPSVAESPLRAHQPPKKKRHIEVSDSDSDNIDETSSIQSTLNKDEPANSNANQQTSTNDTNDQQQSEANDRSPSHSSHEPENGDTTPPIDNNNDKLNGGSSSNLETPTDETPIDASPLSETPKPQQTPQKQTPAPPPSQQKQQQQQQQQQKKEVKKPRLVITKMVLNDFKSYAGRQVIGPFHKVREHDIALYQICPLTHHSFILL
jgi:structural maintenance of chromosome 4